MLNISVSSCKRENLRVANVGKHNFENPLKECEYTHYKLHLHVIFSEQSTGSTGALWYKPAQVGVRNVEGRKLVTQLSAGAEEQQI